MKHSLSKVFSIIVLALILSFQALAQNSDLLDKANKYFELKDYKQAISTYLNVLQQNPNETTVYGKLANSYRFTNDMNNAGLWYLKAVQLQNSDPEHFFQYGKVLQMLGKYRMAEKYFEEYSKVDAVKGKIYAESARFAAQRQGDVPLYTVSKENISSASDDFGAAFYKGKLIYASSRTDLKNGMNDKDPRWKQGKLNQLLISQPNANGTLGRSTVLKKSFKAKTNEGPMSFTADGKTVAYTQNQFINGTRHIPEAGAKMRIYMASVVLDDEWNKPQPFTYNNPEEYNTGYPSLTPNGSAIYFASDMSGGYGGMDIYVCYKTGDSWSAPQNLGSKVNTPGDEIAPFINENALYFSSNYLPGFGGMDIYRAEQINNKWDRVLHLGTGVNSSSDDYGLVFHDNGIGYLTSNRNGNADIYKVEVTSERVEIVVLDDNGQPVSNATIDFSTCGEKSVVTDNNGRFKFIAKSGLDCQGVVVSKRGYGSKVIKVSAANQDLRLLEVRLTREANQENRYIGTVVDANTRNAIPEVKIEVMNMINLEKSETYTDAQGRYGLALAPKTTYKIKYIRNGYTETNRNVPTGNGTDKTILSVQLLEPTEGKVAVVDNTLPDEYDIVDDTKGTTQLNYNDLPKVAYDVQFGVFSTPDRTKFSDLRGYGYIYSQRRTATLKAYKIGAFRTRAEAEKVKAKVQELGYEGAFITKITDKDMLAQVLIRRKSNTSGSATTPPGGNIKPTPPKPKPTTALAYKVQLGAFNNPAFFDKSKVDGLGNISYMKTGTGITLVLLGDFKTYKEAKVLENKVKERGVTAMVVATKNGKKVPLGKASLK
ncbi:MAG: carboxypeptidase regulatory-like domain-containing protein [Saprospiraceae bacterium]